MAECLKVFGYVGFFYWLARDAGFVDSVRRFVLTPGKKENTMHRLLKPYCQTEPRSRTACLFARLHRTVGLIALSGTFAVVPAFAQDADCAKGSIYGQD